MPSLSFLENSGLKFMQNEFNINPHASLPPLEKIKINVSSIAEVCGVTTEATQFIIKKIITALITNCKFELRLNLRIGYLGIKSNQLSFLPTNLHSRCFSSDKTFEEVVSPLNIKSINVKTDRRSRANTSAYATIKVPKTSMSTRRGKEGYVSPSNPNPQYGKQRYPRNNKYVVGFHNVPGTTAFRKHKFSECDTSKEKTLPFPFLSSFLGVSEFYKPGKRLCFGKRMTSQDVHEDQLQQINQKRLELEVSKTLDQGEDRKYLQEFLSTVKHQDNHKKNMYEKLTHEF